MYSKDVSRKLDAKGIRIGDVVKVTKDGKPNEGILMPRPEIGDDNIVILKQKDGYNIGVNAKDATIEKIGTENHEISFPTATMHANSSLPKVALIYTGGTIGSKIDYKTGGVYMLTKPEELLYEVPELAQIAEIKVNNLMSLASEDLTYIEWQKMAEAVADAFNKGARGVVITTGTDTMHYTSAALSFMLQELPGPVVLTGAQRSSDRGSSDAFMNLICSTTIAAKSDIAEVGICMHATSSDDSCHFIRGTKARKMHTSRRDAFRPINSKAIAKVGFSRDIEYVGEYRRIGEAVGKASAATRFEPSVALVKSYPNSDPEILDYYLSKEYKGVIIEATGLGHTAVSTPHKKYSWTDAIAKAVKSGMIIGITSQCLYGRVNASVYRNLRLISNAGAIYCEDMLPEVAYVKLGWLLGNYDEEGSRMKLTENLVGEINTRITYDEFLV